MSIDLRTKYLGLELRSPLVVSACPLSGNSSTLQRMEEAGAAAAVLPSLFEEQIVHEEMEIYEYYEDPSHSFREAQSYFPEIENYNSGPGEYLRMIEAAKKAVSIPIIGSLNGATRGGWVRYARQIQDAGADALELNIYFVASDPFDTAEGVEARYLDIVQSTREETTIPLAVKIGPYFSALPNMARRIEKRGANGLVLFNRFLQPDIDLETLAVTPNLVLSTSDEVRLPLRWIAILRGRVGLSLAATTGVHTPQDALKLLLAGADVTMVASALFKKGPDHLRTLTRGILEWMEQREYASVEQLKGSLSQQNSPHPEAFERANYVKALTNFIGSAIWGKADWTRH